MRYAQAHVSQSDWHNIGNISSSQSALTTNKSASTVNALAATKTVIHEANDGAVAYEYRFRGGSDGDSNVLNVYAMRGDSDHYTLIGTITLTTGTQTDGTYLFIDTITIASELWIDDIVVLSDAANGIARVALNTQGYKNFLFIATTLNSTVVYIDAARI